MVCVAVVKGKRNQSDVEYFDYAYKAHMDDTDKEEEKEYISTNNNNILST